MPPYGNSLTSLDLGTATSDGSDDQRPGLTQRGPHCHVDTSVAFVPGMGSHPVHRQRLFLSETGDASEAVAHLLVTAQHRPCRQLSGGDDVTNPVHQRLVIDEQLYDMTRWCCVQSERDGVNFGGGRRHTGPDRHVGDTISAEPPRTHTSRRVHRSVGGNHPHGRQLVVHDLHRADCLVSDSRLRGGVRCATTGAQHGLWWRY